MPSLAPPAPTCWPREWLPPWTQRVSGENNNYPPWRADGPHSLSPQAAMPKAVWKCHTMSLLNTSMALARTRSLQRFLGTFNPSPELKFQEACAEAAWTQSNVWEDGDTLLISLACPLGEGLGVSQSGLFPAFTCIVCVECINGSAGWGGKSHCNEAG